MSRMVIDDEMWSRLKKLGTKQEGSMAIKVQKPRRSTSSKAQRAAEPPERLPPRGYTQRYQTSHSYYQGMDQLSRYLR